MSVYVTSVDAYEPSVAVTLIDRRFAVTTAAFSVGEQLNLESADHKRFSGEVVSALPTLGLVAIRLAEDAASPTIGPLPDEGSIMTMWFGRTCRFKATFDPRHEVLSRTLRDHCSLPPERPS